MALSFEDSLKAAQAESEAAAAVAAVPAVAEDASVMTLDYGIATTDYGIAAADESGMIAAYSGTEYDTEKYDSYSNWPQKLVDNKVSIIDENKNVSLADGQINLTQESNSQYIPFKMPRYYDGFDLSTATLSIYWVNKIGSGSASAPVNVSYDGENIYFAWLVDKNVTRYSGNVKFEIQATGNIISDKGAESSYVWKTRSSEINVLQALEYNEVIEPDENWQASFFDRVETAAKNAETAAVRAETAAASAEGVSDKVDAAVNNAVGTLEGKVDAIVMEEVSAKMGEYAKTADIEDTLDDYAKLTDLPVNVSELENDSDYATMSEVEAAIADADLDKYATVEYVGDIPADIVDEEGNAIDTVIEYIDYKADSVDVSGQLVEYAKTEYVDEKIGTLTLPSSDDSGIATVAEGDNAYSNVTDFVIAAMDYVDVSDELAGYYTKEETYNKTEVDDKVANVKVDLTGYATETYVNNAVSPLSSSIVTNASGISSLGKTVGELQTTVNSIDKTPRLTYDVAYNNAEDPNVGENVFVLYEITNEGNEGEVKETKAKFTIVGGSGGTATSSTLKISYITTSPIVATTNDNVIIKYKFSGKDSSDDYITDATATWKVGGTIVATETVFGESDTHTGENEFDVTKYLSTGTQKVQLAITDENGSLVTKNWTVQKIDVRLESTFNDKLTYPIGEVSFDYTPYGAVEKVVHFVLDGTEIGTVTTGVSGIQQSYLIPVQEHGAHLLDVYMTATINENDIESNHITKDIIWYDEASTVPVIGTVYQSFTARQYDATNIEYTVYDPTTETPTVEIAVDGNVVATPTLTEATNVYSYKTSDAGKHTITITCGETVKTLIATITELDINVEPVTAGLVFDFNPSGKSNNDVDRVWSTDTVAMTVSDNFDWINGGYQYDENGDQYFCIKAGTSAEIDYQLFADDAKKNGKEFKLVFKTTNVAKPDATFLSCVDNTTNSDHIGIRMDVHEAFIYGQAGNLNLPYSEDDVIEFEFNISKDTEAVPMVMGYEDGVSTRPMVYDGSYNFTQNTPKIISLGSENCDLHIYRFKVYNTSLSASGILNNFIADARNAEEMISRYERNQIYDENQNLTPESLAKKCPWLRVYKVSAPYFTNNKSDKVPNTTIQQIYGNGDPVLDNWTCYDCSHSGQGTSSNNYGAAGRNLDFIMNKSQIEGVKPYFILGDGKTRATEITMTRTSVPVAYLNAKVNIASSNNMTNAMLANRYNEFKPYNRPFVRTPDTLEDHYTIEEIEAMSEEDKANKLAEYQVEAEYLIANTKDTMEFHNCVIFIQETNEDLSTHREFADTNWHFYAIGNIGDSKKTDGSRLTDPDDKYECCVEIMDVELPLSDFPADTMMNAMGYKEDTTTGVRTYTWAKDENLGILHELIDGEYVLTEDTTVDLNKTYYVDILEHDDFSEDYTYGWRYIYEDGTDEENAEVFDYCHQKWIEAYRFITNSTDEQFKAGIGDYFVLDTILYYYLFTTRYTMADNRAKNSFWHYAKTGEVDSEGNPVRKWHLDWMYDCDTSLGLNNYGKQVYRYGLEDTDVDENGEEIFRESDSTFFCRIRDLFPNELRAMYNTLESQNAWHAESFINKADEWQSEFPEELWRLDIDRKYIRTYNSSFINGEGDSQFLVNMANGKMKYHRRQWERSQEKYMASKYQTSEAVNDGAEIRCAKVSDKELVVPANYRLKLTPYAYMYLNVSYGGASPIQLRAEPNIEYEIPFNGDSTDIIKIYSSSLIQSFGDLSTCYPATVETTTASKIKELIIGNETEGYDNPYLTTLTTGANHLLEVLNVENVSGLTQSLDLSALNNLCELYAHGSNASGVTFADGGKIEIAELPAINAINMKNLIYLATLDIADFSKLTMLTVENCNTVDLVSILENAPNVNRVRITGINWTLEDSSLLERLYAMKGFDNNGYNTDTSILSGYVYVPVIKESKLDAYNTMWPNLEIEAGQVTEQHEVTFVNDDGTVLEVQYVDNNMFAIDPVTREDNPIPTPTKESTVSTDYTYAGWDVDLTTTRIGAPRTVRATYTESVREYTIKYVVNMDNRVDVKQETIAKYGTNVVYTGETPTYTKGETTDATHFYLFNRWDKSGIVDGDKIVTAVFDDCQYSEGYFEDKELSDMTPVEVYALTRLVDMGILQGSSRTQTISGTTIETGDAYSFTMGYDLNYEDIESVEVISERRVFTGAEDDYHDTGIALFDEDRDFVLAIDYKMSSQQDTELNPTPTLMQCFQSAGGSNGFKLTYSTSARLSWGTNSVTAANADSREMLVIRHLKGSNSLDVYVSNLDSESFSKHTIDRTTDKSNTSAAATLVFGAEKNDGGRFINNAVGEVNWCKIWYMDLGEDACEKLVGWTHEKIDLEVSGIYRYSLFDDYTKESVMSLLATKLLNGTKQYNAAGNNEGGWAASSLNSFLNTRFYNAIPSQIKSIMKKMSVKSTTGKKSTEITSSGCYVTIPSLYDISNLSHVSQELRTTYQGEASGTINFMLDTEKRKRAYPDGDYASYWTRSPNIGWENYIWYVNASGGLEEIGYGKHGVLIEISF